MNYNDSIISSIPDLNITFKQLIDRLAKDVLEKAIRDSQGIYLHRQLLFYAADVIELLVISHPEIKNKECVRGFEKILKMINEDN